MIFLLESMTPNGDLANPNSVVAVLANEAAVEAGQAPPLPPEPPPPPAHEVAITIDMIPPTPMPLDKEILHKLKQLLLWIKYVNWIASPASKIQSPRFLEVVT